MRAALLLTLTALVSPASAAALAPLSLTAATAVVTQDAGARKALSHYNLEKNSLALSGRDPVAYFPEGGGKAKKGDKKITATHAGVTYRFVSDANRRAFLANPSRFEPAYGGWCAWAMSDGEGDKVEADPDSFTVEDGQLYVFYDGFFNDTRKSWRKKGGAPKRAAQAGKNWSRISGEGGARSLEHWNLKGNLGLGGFDPVAYASGLAQAGQAQRTVEHEGVQYRFISEANAKAFAANPARFEAQYGGWCAYAMAKGAKVQVDPTAFLIEDGKLLLFKNADVRLKWKKDPRALRKDADATWRAL